MVDIAEVVGAILALAGLALILIGVGLLLKFPDNIDELVKIAKDWVDGLKLVAVGSSLLSVGAYILVKIRKK